MKCSTGGLPEKKCINGGLPEKTAGEEMVDCEKKGRKNLMHRWWTVRRRTNFESLYAKV